MSKPALTLPDGQNITLVGSGKMGSALMQGWLHAGFDTPFNVIEPSEIPPEFQNRAHIRHFQSAEDIAGQLRESAVIVLAVKPQVMDKVCAQIKPYTAAETLILSIAAGLSIASYEDIFSSAQPVIRTMPNLPAAVGKGMTVAVANSRVSPTHKNMAAALLSCVGEVEWLADESLMNAVTALIGNGPAYVFYLIEVLAAAAEKQGIPAETAMRLARQTVIGSAALAETSPEDAATLRRNVTSPGGTTEAALKALMNGDMQELFDKALAAGTLRGHELDSKD